MDVLIVISAIVLMMVVAIVAMPVTVFALLLPFAWIIVRLSDKVKSAVDCLLRTVCYTLSNFVGLIAGASVLRISNLMKWFPILICLMIMSGLKHGSLSSRKVTVKKSQKDVVFVANVVGSILASRRNQRCPRYIFR
jgi:hypothetical protein